MTVRVNHGRWLRAEISELCEEGNGKWTDIRLWLLLIQEGPVLVATRATSNKA